MKTDAEKDEDLKQTIKTCCKIGIGILAPPIGVLLVGNEVVKRLTADKDKKSGR